MASPPPEPTAPIEVGTTAPTAAAAAATATKRPEQLRLGPFRPALIVVDVQNDFLPPDGAIAVPGGREIIPVINGLLALRGWALALATQDWHPPDHVSFCTSHPPPDNVPFVSEIELRDARAGEAGEAASAGGPPPTARTKKQRLWPVHAVQGTRGAALADALDARRLDVRVAKGMDPAVEMYSVFSDAFGR
ncbi:NAD(+) salvage pathway protein, partial [Ascosphaera acerosa]